MLFHVTCVHDGAHCPGFHPELVPQLMEAMGKLEAVSAKHQVKVRQFLSAAPEHMEFLLAEAESPMNLAFFLSEFYPMELSQIDVKAVSTVDDMAAAARQVGMM